MNRARDLSILAAATASTVAGDSVPAMQTLSTITTTAGTDPTATGTNDITIPTGYNAVAVWVGSLDESYAYLYTHVKVDSTTTHVVMISNGFYIIRGAAGDVVSFSSLKRTGASKTLANQAVTLTVCPMVEPASLVTPSGATGTANCDKSGPPIWSPSGTPHIQLPTENKTFIVGSASARRELFLVEKDSAGNLSPVRHIHLPANKTVTVQCRHKDVYLANYAGETVSITAPTNTVIGGDSTMYRPSFTASDTIQCDTVAEFVAALTAADDGDDIVLAAGTYDLTSSGNQVNTTNFSAAMGKNIRIRGATGVASGVVFTGAGWRVVLAASTDTWIVESCRFEMSGLAVQSGATGIVDVTGKVHFHNCEIEGPSSTSTAPNLAIRSSAGIGTITTYVTYCTLRNTAEDNLDLDNSGGTLTTYVVGCELDGNDSGASDQVLTCHTGSTLKAYGCGLSDSSQPSNGLKVASDGTSSPLYLRYCNCMATSGNDGLTLSASHGIDGIHFCDFPAIVRAIVTGYVIGSRIVQKFSGVGGVATSGLRVLPSVTSTAYPVFMGNYVVGDDTHTSGYDATDTRYTCELIGNYIEALSTNRCLYLGASNPAASEVITATGNTCKSGSSGTMVDFTSTSNIGGYLTNNIFDAGTSQGSIQSASSGGTFLLTSNYFRRTNTPTNWDTRFPDQLWANIVAGTEDGNNASTSAAGLGADLAPTASGNCDNEGANPGFRGALDIYGRSLYLGTSYVRGCVEIQEIRSGSLLFPVQW